MFLTSPFTDQTVSLKFPFSGACIDEGSCCQSRCYLRPSASSPSEACFTITPGPCSSPATIGLLAMVS
jgi:hypothetical protein